MVITFQFTGSEVRRRLCTAPPPQIESSHTPYTLVVHVTPQASVPARLKGAQGSSSNEAFYTGGWVGRCIVKTQETDSFGELTGHVPGCISVFFSSPLWAGCLLLTTALREEPCALSQEHTAGEETP